MKINVLFGHQSEFEVKTNVQFKLKKVIPREMIFPVKSWRCEKPATLRRVARARVPHTPDCTRHFF